MHFSYVAYSLEGGMVKGRLEADDEAEAQAALRRDGYKPLRITPAWQLPSLEELFPSLFRVGKAELARFTRQLSTLLESGANLLRILEMLQSETRNRILRRTIADILKTLDEGGSLSVALAKHKKLFGPLYVNVVEVGEHTGRLGPALEQLADILQKEHEVRQKAIHTMMYPLAIVGLSMVTLTILVTVALPPLLNVFDQMDAEIPMMTKIAVGASNFVKGNFLKIPLVIVAAIVIFSVLQRIPSIKYRLDLVRLRTPIVGSLTMTGELARFARTIAMLLESGLGLATALQLGRGSCGNLVIRNAIAEAEESLMSGHGVAESLKRHSVFPGMFIQLVTIGEESNSMQRTMGDAANIYQKQHEQRLNTLLGMLEPASTVMVGGIAGFIALSMFLPIYSTLSTIGEP
ncbi:MAG: type II secretion system F family protein [Dehalococcoidia bacterium]